jgi:hypothetical protein
MIQGTKRGVDRPFAVKLGHALARVAFVVPFSVLWAWLLIRAGFVELGKMSDVLFLVGVMVWATAWEWK